MHAKIKKKDLYIVQYNPSILSIYSAMVGRVDKQIPQTINIYTERTKKRVETINAYDYDMQDTAQWQRT